MVTITAAELQNRFGRYRDLAQKEPISVTHHGRESVVLMSADEYKRLKSYDDREVFAAQDIPADLLEEIRKAEPPGWTKELDHLVEP